MSTLTYFIAIYYSSGMHWQLESFTIDLLFLHMKLNIILKIMLVSKLDAVMVF